MSRKSTPDIMAGLMTGATTSAAIEQDAAKTTEHENHKAIIQNISKQSVPAQLRTIRLESNKEINAPVAEVLKEKTTFNLSQSTLEALEDTWMKLRKKLKGETRVTKTLIVEKAISIAINDFETKSELSELFLKLKS